jgi:hypothetical protein
MDTDNVNISNYGSLIDESVDTFDKFIFAIGDKIYCACECIGIESSSEEDCDTFFEKYTEKFNELLEGAVDLLLLHKLAKGGYYTFLQLALSKHVYMLLIDSVDSEGMTPYNLSVFKMKTNNPMMKMITGGLGSMIASQFYKKANAYTKVTDVLIEHGCDTEIEMPGKYKDICSIGSKIDEEQGGMNMPAEGCIIM